MKPNNTIKDIATLAEVSIGTVDRVLHKRGRVSQKSLEKVNMAIKELDYRANPIARTLKSKVTHKIAVLLPNPNLDSYWKFCYDGISEVISEFKAFKVEMDISYFDPTKPKSLTRAAYQLLRAGITALYFVPLYNKESNKIIAKAKKSGILVGTFNSIPSSEVDLCIGQDLFLSGRTAARLTHTALKNASKAAIIHIDENYSNSTHMQEKEEGFKSYYKEHNLHEPLTLSLKSEEFNTKFISFIQKHSMIEALFISTSKTFMAAECLKSLGKKKVTLVGYDLLKENIDYLKSEGIDYLIHQDPSLQASLGLRCLIENLLFNKEFTKNKFLPLNIINSENVDSYLH